MSSQITAEHVSESNIGYDKRTEFAACNLLELHSNTASSGVWQFPSL